MATLAVDCFSMYRSISSKFTANNVFHSIDKKQDGLPTDWYKLSCCSRRMRRNRCKSSFKVVDFCPKQSVSELLVLYSLAFVNGRPYKRSDFKLKVKADSPHSRSKSYSLQLSCSLLRLFSTAQHYHLYTAIHSSSPDGNLLRRRGEHTSRPYKRQEQYNEVATFRHSTTIDSNGKWDVLIVIEL